MGLLSVIKTGLFRSKMACKQHSSDILIGFGIAGVVTGVVVACKETLKLPEVLEEHNKLREKIVTEEEDPKKHRSDIYKLYMRTGLRLACLYIPAALIEAASITAIVKAHANDKKQIMGLTASLAATEQGFKEYRDRVIDRFGEEVDRQLLTGSRTEEVEEIVVDEKGKEKKVKKKVEVADPNATGSGYMKYFTRTNPYWSDDEDQVMWFFKRVQADLNDQLKAIDCLGRDGYVTLNEAYERCGFAKEKKGMIVGWVNDPSHPCSDGFIEITVTPVKIPGENGKLQSAYAVDFNVDGNIFNRIS
ncbi:MAG: hypothetical protein J6U54_11345 [Clostridiales bacterium]|nr:hypothetical protein [Clostridiales bacterium]